MLSFYKNLSRVLFALFIGISIISCSNSPQSAQKKIDTIAAEMKPQLPKMLDKDTRLVKVYTEKMELISEYELINYSPGTADYQNEKDKIEFYLTRQVCPDIKKELLSRGISSRYIYKGNKGKVIVDKVITSGDC